MSAFIEMLYVVGILLSVVGGAYAAYWSFIIRRSLRAPIYRRQTFTVGLVSLYGTFSIVLFYAVYFFDSALPPSLVPVLVAIQEFLYGIMPSVLLVWADSSIGVGRRLDPLLRDSFRWSKLRLAVWPSMALSNFAFIVGSGLTMTFDLLAKVGLASGLVLLGLSMVVAFSAARRAGDRNYRRSLEWFVAFLAFFLIYNAGFFPLLVVSFNNLFAYTPVDLFWAVVANLLLVPLFFYCSYRCSRSLVPLNRMEVAEATPRTAGALTAQ